MDLSAASGMPAPDHPAGLVADDSVGAAPSAAGRRSAGPATTTTVAATVHALRTSSAQVCRRANEFALLARIPCLLFIIKASGFSFAMLLCLLVCSAKPNLPAFNIRPEASGFLFAITHALLYAHFFFCFAGV